MTAESSLKGTSLDDSAPNDLEKEIAAAIDPWLAHMKWRKDFTTWRERRIRQEDYQSDGVREVRRVLGGLFRGRTILDLGSGMGGLSVALLREYGVQGMSLQAMDYNPEYCKIARLRARRYGLSLNILVAAGEQLPYPDNSFNAVVCLDVLEHVADAALVLKEIYRVLKPGGVVLTSVPNRYAFRDPHYHLPLINWLPRFIGEAVVRSAGRSKQGGPLQDRQGLAELNTYSWRGIKRLTTQIGFRISDQVHHRITRGEIRQLRGLRKRILVALMTLQLADPLYALYRFGWQGTYQIMLVKPRETHAIRHE